MDGLMVVALDSERHGRVNRGGEVTKMKQGELMTVVWAQW